MSFSIETVQKLILWKRSKYQSLHASRDDHSRSSNISLTLLEFRNLLLVQPTTVLYLHNLVNLSFRVKVPNRCCILDQTTVFCNFPRIFLVLLGAQKVSMARKCHNHRLQSTHGSIREKETQNTVKRNTTKVKQPALSSSA